MAAPKPVVRCRRATGSTAPSSGCSTASPQYDRDPRDLARPRPRWPAHRHGAGLPTGSLVLDLVRHRRSRQRPAGEGHQQSIDYQPECRRRAPAPLVRGTPRSSVCRRHLDSVACRLRSAASWLTAVFSESRAFSGRRAFAAHAATPPSPLLRAGNTVSSQACRCWGAARRRRDAYPTSPSPRVLPSVRTNRGTQPGGRAGASSHAHRRPVRVTGTRA
jgi:hypothetical protein